MSTLKLKMTVLIFIIGATLSFSKEKNDEAKKVNTNTQQNKEQLEDSSQEIIDDSSKIDEEIIDEQKNKSANENLKYSQRNDGIIDINSLKHEENSEYRIKDGKNVKIMMKTKNNDVYSVEVIYKNGKKMMRGIGNYGGNEIFMAEIPSNVSSYYFVLTDDKTKYYMGSSLIFYSNTLFSNSKLRVLFTNRCSLPIIPLFMRYWVRIKPPLSIKIQLCVSKTRP